MINGIQNASTGKRILSGLFDLIVLLILFFCFAFLLFPYVGNPVVTVFVSLLLSFSVSEFSIPLLLGKGRTLGKLIFSLEVRLFDGSELKALKFAIRTFAGKLILETMIPVIYIISALSGNASVVGLGALVLIVSFQFFYLSSSGFSKTVHDVLSGTVVLSMR